MTPRPTGEWIEALGRMANAIAGSLSELDRYERDWSGPSETSAGSTAPAPAELFAWFERRLSAWDARLTEAVELTSSIETHLGERESALGRWHDLFLRWQEMIQRGKGPVAISGGPNGLG
jgi:hypothetical protein